MVALPPHRERVGLENSPDRVVAHARQSRAFELVVDVQRTMIRRMLAHRTRGRIVFVGSWAAHAPHPHIGAYSATKAGLRALCQTLALDHAADGILVNEVAPGIVDAGLSHELFRRDPALEQRTRAAIPTGLVIEPTEVARDIVFLASPDNRHTTSACLVTDGAVSISSKMNPGTRS